MAARVCLKEWTDREEFQSQEPECDHFKGLKESLQAGQTQAGSPFDLFGPDLDRPGCVRPDQPTTGSTTTTTYTSTLQQQTPAFVADMDNPQYRYIFTHTSVPYAAGPG